MGWFWADPAPPPSSAPQPLLRSRDARPPSGCPMHRSNPTSPTSSSTSAPPLSSGCPSAPRSRTPSSQPIRQTTLSKLNPLNYMPTHISNDRSENQSVALPLVRETSTIRKEDGTHWEYPSPQQMYNAMLRKGYTDTPQDAVESMVAVHNFLNEGAWAEILEWERRFGPGLAHGWRASRRGEDGTPAAAAAAARRWQDPDCAEPKLARFHGRPGDTSPKARLHAWLAWLMPSTFANVPPFDRHDWFVLRHRPDGSAEEVRYVIDYYEGPPEPSGEPVFFLDVRPAVDSPTAACERLIRFGGDVWWRGAGGAVREEQQERVREEQEKHRVPRRRD